MALAYFAAPMVFFVGCKSSDLDSGDIPPARLPEALSADSYSSPAYSAPVEAGDILELFVEEDNSFNGRYSVRERGDIIIPTVGRIPVAGMSVSDAGVHVRSKLEATHLKKASVIIDRVGRAQSPAGNGGGHSASGQSIRIFMTGKVNRPGQHRIPVSESGSVGVYEAILIAGGVSQFGDLQKVHLLRSDESGKRRRVPVDIRSIEKGLAVDPPIGDGDIVVVPEKIFGF